MIACAGVGGVCVAPSRARPMLAAATCFSLPSFVALNEFYVNFTSADFCQSNTETSHTPSLSHSRPPLALYHPSLAVSPRLLIYTLAQPSVPLVGWIDACVCECARVVCMCVQAHNDKFNNNLALSSTKDGRETPWHLFAQVVQIFLQSRSFCLIAYFDSHYACHKARIWGLLRVRVKFRINLPVEWGNELRLLTALCMHCIP